VPVNFSNLKSPKEDMFWVGIAGPAANILTAVILAVFLKIPELSAIMLLKIVFSQMIVMNVVLAVFNMLPLPPLDGSRILFSILPNDLAYMYMKLERYGMFILLALLWLGVTDKFIWPIVSSIVKFMGV
jgi:Zn-dependent protease